MKWCIVVKLSWQSFTFTSSCDTYSRVTASLTKMHTASTDVPHRRVVLIAATRFQFVKVWVASNWSCLTVIQTVFLYDLLQWTISNTVLHHISSRPALHWLQVVQSVVIDLWASKTTCNYVIHRSPEGASRYVVTESVSKVKQTIIHIIPLCRLIN